MATSPKDDGTDGGAVRLPSPAGAPARAPAEAARRSGDLGGKTVVVVNNGQADLEVATFGRVVDWVTESVGALEPKPVVESIWQYMVISDLAGLKDLERRILDLKPAGVAFVLCHAGVTAPSAILAGNLERAGIPTVLVCTPLGEPLADFIRSNDVPNLPIVLTEPVRNLSDSGIADQKARVGAEVCRALTSAPDAAAPSPLALPPEIPMPAQIGSMAELDRASELTEIVWQELLDRNLNDGLPVVVPTNDRVERMLAGAGRSPDEVLVSAPIASGAHITVGKAAVNAVLAGCLPEYLPVVLAAVEAMDDNDFRLFQTAITTHPGGISVAVSGPVADRLGIASGPGCLGPGFRANATIGRAVSLTLFNVARTIPGVTSLATFGSPAQYSLCFAEALAETPWSPAHVELYDEGTSCVTVLKCESPHNVISSAGPEPEALLQAAASSMATLGANGIRYPADHLVLINPPKAKMFAKHGYTKRDVQMYLFEHARVPADRYKPSQYLDCLARWTHTVERMPVVHDPSQFRIFVAGGIGQQMMVAPPWGLSQAITRPIAGT